MSTNANVSNKNLANELGRQWLMPVILATQEAEIKPARANSSQDYLKNPITKNWTGGVAQGEGPEFKLQFCKQNKTKQNLAN
jgi:hypothetical protein